MPSVTALISKHTDRRTFNALTQRYNDLWDLALQSSDPAERTGLLFCLSSVGEEMEPVALRLHGAQSARWHAEAAVVLRYAALAEQALYEAKWSAAADLKADGTIWRDGDQRRIVAVAGGQQLGDGPIRVVVSWQRQDGDVQEELAAAELVQTRPTTVSPALEAVMDGAAPQETRLWEALVSTPDRAARAAVYRELAELPDVGGEPFISHELLLELGRAEFHLAPEASPHPHLVAQEREAGRAWLSERIMLFTAICAFFAFLATDDGLPLWTVILSGLTVAAACRFGAHQAAARLLGKNGR